MPNRSLIRNRPGLGRGRAPEGRRGLDLAEGILIGLRRYSAEAAFDELVTVAHRHDITTSAVASALVNLATGDADATDSPPPEVAIARLEWGGLLLAAEG
jgi:hypothetical protein